MMEPRLFRIATLIYYGTYMVKALIWIPLFGGGFAAHDVPTLLYWTALSATAIYLVTVIVTAFVWRSYGTFDQGYRGERQIVRSRSSSALSESMPERRAGEG
jgi:hypothetical protein